MAANETSALWGRRPRIVSTLREIWPQAPEGIAETTAYAGNSLRSLQYSTFVRTGDRC